jgi:prepilin-type N-terminal cleavage/methylation domain-containing protein
MRQRGVTLIELIVVIVAMTAGMALLGSYFIEPAQSVAVNENIQVAWQGAQACADFSLGRARAPGSTANITTGMADPCPAAPVGATRSFVVANLAGGTEPCAGAAWTCRTVTVSVTKNTYTASVTFMVVDY